MEMLPLIDVVFLLLVFFIYAMLSMVMHRGLKVDLPTAGTTQLDRSDYIALTIDAQNNLYINGEPAAFSEAGGRVLALRAGGDKPVFIEGDRRAELGPAVALLDDLRRLGIEEVSFSCRQATP